MKRCLTNKKMKTKVLFLGAVCAGFTFSSFAGDVFLSPRAQDNQIKIVRYQTGTPAPAVAAIVVTAPGLLSPRAADNQLKTVSGTANETNPYLQCQKMMTGSPKAVQACADNPAMPVCNKKLAMTAPQK
jgi:hypothetical protein